MGSTFATPDLLYCTPSAYSYSFSYTVRHAACFILYNSTVCDAVIIYSGIGDLEVCSGKNRGRRVHLVEYF